MTAAETYGNGMITISNDSNITPDNCSNHRQTLVGQPSSPGEPIELVENFYINNNNKRKHNLKIQVELNGSGIYLRRETPEHDQITEQLIRLADIVGSHCRSKLEKRAKGGGLSSCKRLNNDEEQHHSVNSTGQQHKDISAYLYIYAYVRKDKPLRRMRTVRILRFRSFVSFEENLKSAERWRNAIKLNKSLEENPIMERKPLLVLLNPKSGSGKGRIMFQKQVAPVLKEADVPYELVVTTHANFARELVRQRKDLVETYSGIVVASGDGLFFEVLNGMMERPDWRMLTRNLPLGIIPCGSGNGLAKSIAHLYNEPYEPKPIVNATITCASGQSAPLDIVRVELRAQGNITELYSFLSVGWGLIADIDIESEKLRSIGAPRFTLWCIHRLLHLRTHKGKLSYLPWRKMESSKLTETEVRSQTIDSSDTTCTTTQQSERPSILRQFHDALDEAPESEFSDVATEADVDGEGEFADNIARSSDRTHIDSWHSAFSRRTAYYSIAGQSTRSNRSITASVISKIEEANVEFNTRALQSTIPPLNMPLSEQWHSEQGEFVMVHAAYTTHLATDCFFAPDSKLNDGIIYLVLIRAGVSKTQLLEFLLKMSSGTHLSEAPTEHIAVIPVTAFRIEPQDEDGIITVDGERVDYGEIQAEIFPGLVRVMVPSSSVL